MQAPFPTPTNREEYITLLDEAIRMGKALNSMWDECFANLHCQRTMQKMRALASDRGNTRSP